LLQVDDRWILVDAGDGTVNQLARVGRTVGDIDSVFISHHHLDHTGGLAAVIGLRWMNSFPGVVTIYGPPGTRELVDALIASMAPQARVGFGIGEAPPPPAGSVRVIELTGGQTVKLGGLKVTTVENTHFTGPGSTQPGASQSLSYRFDFDNRRITYTGDTGPSDAVTRLAQGSDLLVSEVIDLDRLLAAIRRTRSDMSEAVTADIRLHLSTHHLSGEEVGKIAAAANVGHVLLTHFAIPPGPLADSASNLRAGVRVTYRGPLDLARDLGSYDVGCEPRRETR
jgi:ribonuclease BN (tRNA processing enzyme)